MRNGNIDIRVPFDRHNVQVMIHEFTVKLYYHLIMENNVMSSMNLSQPGVKTRVNETLVVLTVDLF